MKIISVLLLSIISCFSNEINSLENLLSSKNSEKALSQLQASMRSRNLNTNIHSRVVLSRLLRKTGESKKAIKLLDKFKDFKSSNLVGFEGMAFLEYSLCLAKEGEIRLSEKYISYSLEKSQGLIYSLSLAAKAELFFLAKDFKESLKHYDISIKKGDSYFKPKTIKGESSEEVKVLKVEGDIQWQHERKLILQRRNKCLRELEKKMYGEDFVNYKEARMAHLGNQYAIAIASYKKVISKHPDTVYSEASKFYLCECLFYSREFKLASLKTSEFIKKDKLGLYRGEALFLQAKIALFGKGDLNTALLYLNETQEWITKVKKTQQEIKLYLVPDKAKKVTSAPKSGYEIKLYDLQDRVFQPSAIINRTTANWYLNKIYIDSTYYIGCIKFLEEKFEEADKFFSKAYELNETLKNISQEVFGSVYNRMSKACFVKKFMYFGNDLKGLKEYDRLQFKLAGFLIIWNKWNEAKWTIRPYLRSNNSNLVALALVTMGELVRYKPPRDYDQFIKLHQKVYESHKKSNVYPRALSVLADGDHIKPEEFNKRLKLFQELFTKFPNDYYSIDGHFNLAIQYAANADPINAEKWIKTLIKKYPDYELPMDLEAVIQFAKDQPHYKGKK